MSVSIIHYRNSEGVVATDITFRVILQGGWWRRDLAVALSCIARDLRTLRRGLSRRMLDAAQEAERLETET